MNRKTITIIAIAIELIILGSFIVRYETLKSTGTTLYIPLRGYDPTDIFRWDYINLAYELPYNGVATAYSSERQYLIPEIQGRLISGVRAITTTRPTDGTYFQIKNGWSSARQEIYTLETGSGEILTYTGTTCLGNDYKITDTVYYAAYTEGNKSIYSISKEQWKNINNIWEATILTKSACTGTYRFQTTATDRWFVKEWTGLDLEKKIRKWDMYAEWKAGNNGTIIISNILTKEQLPK